MDNVVCLKHPNYNGSEEPILSCKTCCKIFVHSIKEQQRLRVEKIQQTIHNAKAVGESLNR